MAQEGESIEGSWGGPSADKVVAPLAGSLAVALRMDDAFGGERYQPARGRASAQSST